jgi:hypothetical protein
MHIFAIWIQHDNYERTISFQMCKVLYLWFFYVKLQLDIFVDLTLLEIFFNFLKKDHIWKDFFVF